MNILFTPIGNTDPITNNLDGAMLHICRHCAIDKVIMYLSKDICAIHHKDNRYVAMVEKLAALQGRTIECEIMERPDLEDVQVFDYFIEEYDSILNELEKQYPDDELYLNVSSGTPAMKSALHVLAYYRSRNYKIIQVKGPGYSAQRKEFDIRTAFKENLDNNPATKPRIEISKNQNLIRQSAKKIITELINKYDYSGALTTAKNSGITDERFLTALNASDRRYKFFLDDAKKLYEEAGVNIAFKSDVEEYLMMLQIKAARSEYADFLRAVTPLVYELDKLILKHECGFDVNNYIIDTPGGEIWDIKKLNKSENTVDNLAYNSLISKYKNLNTVYSSHLQFLITKLSGSETILALSKDIREIEERRNKTAHRLDGTVGKAFLQSKKPLQKLFDYSIHAGVICIPDDISKNEYYQAFFNEYTAVNKKLKEMLNNN
ncbi:MAG: hypothetical protein IJM32_06625 [Ruminococcus sp.]|nr:hypothetical protein [Ruminococcus sp.]